MISRSESRRDDKSTERMTSISSRLLLLVIFPITVGAAILAEPLISLIYERGAFGASDVALTATALRFFALGMPALAINELLTKLFFAKQNVKVPMISALLSIAADLVFAYLLTASLGVAGIALASTLAVAVNMTVNYACLRASGAHLAQIFGMIFSSLVMGVAVYFVYGASAELGALVSLVLSVLSGAAVYGVMILLVNLKKIYTRFKRSKK